MAGYNITQNQKITSRAIISALVLWLAFSGMAAAEQFYVNEGGWWRVDGAFNASGTPISAAVGAAAAGDAIYVWNGSYYENVDVDKSRLTLEGEGADVVIVTAADPDDHVFEVTQDCVNISGFTAMGAACRFMAGFHLYNADHCNVSGNTACENDRGIYLRASSNNILMNNAANSNNERGIYLSSSSSNTIANNTANSNKDFGIYLLYSSSNTIANNIASQRWYGGIYLQYSSYNTIVENDCSNNVYAIGICLQDSSNYNTLTCNNASNNGHGIYIEWSSNSNTLTSNTANSNGITGIYIGHSSNNMLTGNTANLNDNGIGVYGSSDNTLMSNTANLNSYYGIRLWDSSNGNLINNTANSNGNYGIQLYSSSNCMLESNTANSNEICGIYLQYLSNSHITCNWIQDNTVRGFYLYGSTGNNISYNNIITNGNYNTMSGGWEWQFYNDQSNHIEAKHNYWGAGMDGSMIDASIYDNEEGKGTVVFYPFETGPVCAPTPVEPPAFTTADAVIALQIAAGSRPPDLCWDVSGDGSVTSLDALMILQAAAGKIEIGHV